LSLTPPHFVSLSGWGMTRSETSFAFLRDRIATTENPRRFGKPLRGGLKSLWRYRVGDYRLICDIRDETLVVLVVRAGHRRNIYD
jgi:mRNA interferase RelE/StbE